MSDYLIGSGAILTAGPRSTIAAATLHVQTDALLAHSVRAAVVDFESGPEACVQRIVAIAAGWSQARFQAAVVPQLLRRGDCTLASVMAVLQEATRASQVHLFARWLPSAEMLAQLSSNGTPLVVLPLESLRQAALISGQRFTRWQPAFRAA